MASRSFRPGRRRPTDVDPAAVMRDAMVEARKRRQGYRERSLALHGWICARCAREFERSSLHLLTVHHKDGNHDHNPADGSNWENLCVYCHDAEHSTGLLGDYLRGKE
jgi:hypothetical protein